MHERDLKGIDLNLLVVFAIVMREGTTTAAASQLCLTQSAVSQSLRRLRLALGDELFVRDGKGISPTPWALELYKLISPSLNSIGAAIRQNDRFDPATSTRRFRVRLKTTLAGCIASHLMARINRAAPGVSVQFITGEGNVSAWLDNDDCDLAICIGGLQWQPWHREHKFEPVPLYAVFDGKRLRIKPPISLKTYLSLPHLVSPVVLARPGSIDALLAKHNLSRPHKIITNDFAAYPAILKTTDAIANCPLPLARSYVDLMDLTISPLPFDEEALYRYGMVWHARNENDTGHAWLRSLCLQIVADLEASSCQKKHRALA